MTLQLLPWNFELGDKSCFDQGCMNRRGNPFLISLALLLFCRCQDKSRQQPASGTRMRAVWSRACSEKHSLDQLAPADPQLQACMGACSFVSSSFTTPWNVACQAPLSLGWSVINDCDFQPPSLKNTSTAAAGWDTVLFFFFFPLHPKFTGHSSNNTEHHVDRERFFSPPAQCLALVM